ncbi:MAG: DUF2851 family protein [Verrucomicrobia bacterium]|nr:DUF2851 family protein [Verrucomicrobiota bacterium]
MPRLPPDLYARWRAAAVVFEALHDGASAPPPNEHLLQLIWLHQRLRRDELSTTDGRPVVVLHPGFWNRGEGPDFRGAIVQLGDDPPRVGDIEVDLRAQAWRQHRHQANPAYAAVQLHVVWERPARPPPAPPTLVIADRLDAPLAELSAALGAEPELPLPGHQSGDCADPLAGLAEGEVADLLEGAARTRLELKGARFERRAREVGWEQALWEGLFAGLGYRHNVWPMRRLGELLPRLRAGRALPTHPLAWQARLLGVAGLLPTEPTRSRHAADEYLRSIWDLWWRERAGYADCLLPRQVWRFHGVRPANHPQRRLALAAHWVSDPGWIDRLEEWLTEDLTPAALAPTLARRLSSPPDPFWSRHGRLGAARLAKKQPLLGAPRVTDLAINIVLPWFWSRARAGRNETLAQRVAQRYFAWRPAQDNALLRQARRRLWRGNRRGTPRTAAQQQGVLQILGDFCDHSNALCADCRFPGLVAGLAEQAPDGERAEGPAAPREILG